MAIIDILQGLPLQDKIMVVKNDLYRNNSSIDNGYQCTGTGPLWGQRFENSMFGILVMSSVRSTDSSNRNSESCSHLALLSFKYPSDRPVSVDPISTTSTMAEMETLCSGDP